MRIGFLTTRVGRRFLAVNLLTALVPVAVIAAVSFASVKVELRDQAQKRVQRLSKSSGITTLTYLAALQLKLSQASVAQSATSDFDRIIHTDLDAGVPSGLGQGLARTITAAEMKQLRDGRSVLLLVHDGIQPAVILSRAELPWTASAKPVVWARVRHDALFNEVEEAVGGEDAGYCIFETASMARVSCSRHLDASAIQVATSRARAGGNMHDATLRDGYFVSARDIYLRHAYAAPEWRTVVMQPERASFAAAATFRNTFALLCIAVVFLIFGVSHAQIRRTTEPLTRLQDGTRRLQAGDFSRPVIVQGNDEYAELSTSFNGMAATLHRQITLMHHLDAVDQSALGTHDIATVVNEALACLAGSIDATAVTIAVVAQDDHDALDAAHLDIATGRRSATRLLLGKREREELLASPRVLLLDADAAPRTYLLGDVLRPPMLVLPMVHDQDLRGLIAIRVGRVTANADSWSEARRLADRVSLAVSNVQLLTRLDALSAGTVLAFARAIDANSPWTAGHSERVTRVAMEIGRELRLAPAELDNLERGGLLHDIGKIAVPPAVLDKAGRLNDEEWAVMRRHPVVGCEILAPIPAFADALPIVRSHHERMDGTGYPDRLYGEDIPLLARVLAVADVFDALASDRPYRAGMTTAEACDIIQKGSGTHFDPTIVHAFMDAVHAGRIQALLPINESRSLAASVARARIGTLQRT